MLTTVPRRLGSSARHVADDVSDGDGATQRQERTRSHGRERSIGELDSLPPYLHRNLSNPIRRMNDGVRRVIYGNMQRPACLADPGKRLVGERIHDVMRRSGGAVGGAVGDAATVDGVEGIVEKGSLRDGQRMHEISF